MLPKFLLLFAAVFTAACCAKVLQVEADSSASPDIDRLSSVDLDGKAGFRHHERLPRMRTTTTGLSRPRPAAGPAASNSPEIPGAKAAADRPDRDADTSRGVRLQDDIVKLANAKQIELGDFAFLQKHTDDYSRREFAARSAEFEPQHQRQLDVGRGEHLAKRPVTADERRGYSEVEAATADEEKRLETADNLIEERSGTDRGADPGFGLHAELDNNDESRGAEFEFEETTFDDDLAGAGMPREEDEFDDESESLYIAELAKKFNNPPPPRWLVCRVMERIQQIFRLRLPAHYVADGHRQFAVMAIIPRSVVNQAQLRDLQHTNNQIDALMAEQHADVNYRFALPGRFGNERCFRHAERLAITGRPYERNYNLRQFYNNFVRANPDHTPAFVVIYTWIHPCERCTDVIVSHFGASRAHGVTPVFNIPTYVGRTTPGTTDLIPPFTDEIREVTEARLLLFLIPLFIIRIMPAYNPNGVALEEHDDLDLALMEANGDSDLCDDCYINSYLLKNTYNCDTGGKSTPENPTCAINGLRSAEKINGTSVELRQSDPCCSPASTTGLFTAAQGQKCRSDSPCAFGDNTYPQCTLEGGSTEYCCTGECGNHGNTHYDWCESGSEYQVCATRGHIAGRSRTAKGEKCRSDHQCGYHGKNYAWCYKEDGEEDYCCASECSNHGGEKYDWCTVGAITLQQKCQRENLGSYSKDGLKCRGDSPCGFHEGTYYAWCYLEQGEYGTCCTTACSPKGSAYDWCTSGDYWDYCKVHEFPTPGHTYKMEKCRDDHQCGYYGELYAWCYTESGSPTQDYDYCCTQECGLNGEKYDWCTIG